MTVPEKVIPMVVAFVAVVGLLCTGTLVCSYVTVKSFPKPMRAEPKGTEIEADQASEKKAPDRGTVESTRLDVGGFVLGLSQPAVERLARKNNLEFEVTHGASSLWNAVPKHPRSIKAARLAFVGGELVGLRVELVDAQPARYATWADLLDEPYRADSVTDHWQTEDLKAKARRDGTKFYVVRKDYDADFSW